MRTATPGNLSKLLPEAVHHKGRTPIVGQHFSHFDRHDIRIPRQCRLQPDYIKWPLMARSGPPEMSAQVRYQVKSGHQMLVTSFSAFDPFRTLARRISAQDVVLRAFCRSRKMRIAAEGSPLWTAFAKLSMPASIAARSGMSSHERISCFCSRTAPGEHESN